MKDTQIKLISALADELRKEKVTKESAMRSLIAANIITEKGNFKRPYRNLQRLIGK